MNIRISEGSKEDILAFKISSFPSKQSWTNNKPANVNVSQIVFFPT